MAMADTASGLALQEVLPIHKDFYLRHPSADLQSEEWCWGNLEKVHPVLGQRPMAEVQQYRETMGLTVDVLKGSREAPKPFQSFEETSFPQFVIDLAYELFTKSATPFGVQAQTWPCALSGMDVVAVAPTGNGKTLAYLLPAFVHIMAQPALQQNDGPIVLVLVPTRELAAQTLAVAQRFCARTHGDDRLRAEAVYGGVEPQLQLPPPSGETQGLRWPEILVATPGRLIRFMSQGHLTLSRASYIVVDEADLMLQPGSWLEQTRGLLEKSHPDRQLLFISATWSDALQGVAERLSSAELVQIRVFPDVLPIPQDVRLFPDADMRSTEDRRAALLEWMRNELQPEESLLLLCHSQVQADGLVADRELLDALGPNSEAAYLHGASAYKSFVQGDIRMLVATLAVGSRGLDFADTVAAASRARKLSLVVVIFDFPATLADYIHCIGRTFRPGQVGGRALVFLPSTRFWMAREVMELLTRCGQHVPFHLTEIVRDDTAFLTECKAAMGRMHSGLTPWPERAGAQEVFPFKDSLFDAEKMLWTLPAELTSYRRRLVHMLGDESDMPHVSTGVGPARRLHLAPDRKNLPEAFFMEGELVRALTSVVNPRVQPGSSWICGRVTVPRVHPRHRTIAVLFDDHQQPMHIRVDDLELCEQGKEAGNGFLLPLCQN